MCTSGIMYLEEDQEEEIAEEVKDRVRNGAAMAYGVL